MYGDATAIRRLAGGLRDQAAEIRAEADRLVARTDAAGLARPRRRRAARPGARAGPGAAPLGCACTTTPPTRCSGTPARSSGSSG